MAVLAYHCTKWPDTQLSIIFLPMFMFSAGMVCFREAWVHIVENKRSFSFRPQAIKAVIAFDVAGCVLGWKIFDHMAHLGGALFGMWVELYNMKSDTASDKYLLTPAFSSTDFGFMLVKSSYGRSDDLYLNNGINSDRIFERFPKLEKSVK